MDGWLSKDLEKLNAIQEKFCNDTDCTICYFNNRAGCLGDVVTDIGFSYRQLEHVYTVFINQMEEQF